MQTDSLQLLTSNYIKPYRITVKRESMKVSSNEIWEQAEVLAKSINEAYKNEKKHDGQVRNVSEDIQMSVKKPRFVCICRVIAEYMPIQSDCLGKAVAFAISLPMEKEAENKDISFEMFIACVRFHLAFYKRDWKEHK